LYLDFKKMAEKEGFPTQPLFLRGNYSLIGEEKSGWRIFPGGERGE
jgi:hypothetical protein